MDKNDRIKVLDRFFNLLVYALLTILVGFIVIIGLVALVKSIKLDKKEDIVCREHFIECKDNLVQDNSYTIITSVYNDYSEYIYLDSKIDNEMYSENQIGDTNNYELISWSEEDGTTYALQQDNYWVVYPKKFNEIALAAKGLDLDLWVDSMQDIVKVDNEQLELGYSEGKSDVEMYTFTINLDKVSEIVGKKFDTIYYGIVEELAAKNESGIYDEVIKIYEKHIEELKDSYTFTEIKGKVGICNNKIAVFSVDIIGGGDMISYSKIVAYDTFQKRMKPDFTQEDILRLEDVAYSEYIANLEQ